MTRKHILMVGPSLNEPGGMGTVQKLIFKHVPPGYDIQHISTWNRPPNKASTLYTFRCFVHALIAYLNKLLFTKIDLIHIHIAERGSVLRKSILMLIALAFKKPILLHTHGCEFHVFYNQLSSWQKKLVNWLLQKSTFLLTLSESWNEWYTKNCSLRLGQTLILKNPVELPQVIPPKLESKQLNFLFLGKINQRKGVFDMLEAVAKIPVEHRQKLKLILAGSGEVEEAKSLACNLKIEQHLIFPGWVNAEQRDEFLAQADVFLLPSYNEGLPMALLEAMSWKLPAITTPVGGIPEVIKDNQTGLLVNPGDVEKLAEVMEDLIVKEAFRKRLGEAAYQQIKPLNIEDYMDSLTNIYDKIIDNPSWLHPFPPVVNFRKELEKT